MPYVSKSPESSFFSASTQEPFTPEKEPNMDMKAETLSKEKQLPKMELIDHDNYLKLAS